MKEHWPNDPTWHLDFGPSYTPLEMIQAGVFEGLYTGAIDEIPKEWKDQPTVLPRGGAGDPKLNKYGIKSRLDLREWQINGWTTEHSPLGWFQWYCLYYLGRRIPVEDEFQIRRWYSFVARHQAQVTKGCRLDDDKCRPRQRQGLLQWAWDSSTSFTPKTRHSNAQRISKAANVPLGNVAVEFIIEQPEYVKDK